MTTISDNETWVVEAGADVVEKRAQGGFGTLSSKEHLLYWLWWADYMMRNAGDFANAETLERDFQAEAASIAQALGLTFTCETFSLPRTELERQYFERFERMCSEIRNA